MMNLVIVRLLSIFTITFGIISLILGLYIKNDSAKSEYLKYVAAITALTSSIGLGFYWSAFNGNIIPKLLVTFLIIINALNLFIDHFSTVRKKMHDEIFNQFVAICNSVILSEKEKADLFFDYLITKDEALEKKIIEDNIVTEDEMALVNHVITIVGDDYSAEFFEYIKNMDVAERERIIKSQLLQQ